MMLLSTLALAAPLCGSAPPSEARPLPLVPRSAGDLQVRGAFADRLDVLETEHFAVKWIATQDPLPSQVEAVGAVLEHVWAEHVERMGWQQPAGTEVYKMNVYLGYPNTYGIPSIDFSGGYATPDEEGFAYIVISPDALELFEGTWLQDLLAHEFHHTLQMNHQRYLDPQRGFSWWETTASWAVPYVWEDVERANYADALEQPHLSILSWSLDEHDPARWGKQYASAAFAWTLSETHDVELIRRSWEDPHDFDSPLEWLDQELEEGIDQAFIDYAVAMATEDHSRAEAWRDALPGDTNQVTARVDPRGTGDWIGVHEALYPEGWSWNRIDYEATGSAEVFVDFDPVSPRALDAFVWTEIDGTTAVQPLGEGLFLQMEDGDRLRLIVVATPERYVPERTYPYEYRIAVVQPQTGVPYDPTDGLTCSSLGGRALSAGWSRWLRR